MSRRRQPRFQSVPRAPEPGREALVVPEAAFMANVSVATAWKLIGDGTWPSFRIGRKRLVSRARLLDVLNGSSHIG